MRFRLPPRRATKTGRRAPRRVGLAATALLAASAVIVVGQQPAAAAGGPFSCQPGFYQVISGQLEQLNPLTGVYTPIGSAYPSYNAMGYNVADNYLYAVSTTAPSKGHLLRIGSDGAVTDLGLPTGLPAASVVSGDFDDQGNLIVQSSASTYYSINVASMTATQFTVTGTTASANDMVWINGTIYSMSGSTLYKVDLSTHVSTATTVAGVTSGAFGSGWSDRPDELFFSDNNTGNIYKLSGFTGSSPTGTLKLSGTVTSNNDGAACKQAESPFNPPTATADTYSVTTNQTLTVPAGGVLSNDVGSGLTAVKTTDPAHGNLTLNSDGSFSYAPEPGYSGADTFTYTPTDQFGQSATAPATVTISVNLPPAPSATDDSFSTPTGQALSTTGAGVLDNDDGTGITVTAYDQPTQGSVTISAAGALAYTPPTGYSGTQTIGYTVTDEFGRTATATVHLATTPTTAADSYSTPANHTLTVDTGNGVLTDDTGSGLTASLASGAAHGTLILEADGGFTYVADTGYYGSDSFTYTATDTSDQQTAPVTVSLGISAPAPPVATDDAFSTPADQNLTADADAGVLANDGGSDIRVTSNTQPAHGSVTVATDGAVSYFPPAGYSGTQTFSYTATDDVGQTDTATVELTTTPVSIDDAYSTIADHGLSVEAASGVLANDTGSGLQATLVEATSHGAVALDSDGSFDYTPNTGYHGTDSFTYTATDGSDLVTATRTVVLTIDLPAAPTATDDTYSTTAGQTRSVTATQGVLANDNGALLTVTNSTQPAHGSATVGTDGAVTFTPSATYSGTDSFIYTATDEFGRTATATVHLSTTPVGTADGYAATANTTLTVAAPAGVLTNDTGSTLHATVDEAPTHGIVTLGAGGGFAYVPDTGYYGSDSFSYVATDGSGLDTAPVTVTLTVALPNGPTAVDDSFTTAAATDLTVAAANGVLGNDSGAAVTVTSWTQPAHGTVSVTADGAISYTPPAGYSGHDTFSYTITDDFGRTSTATVQLSTTPVASADSYPTTANETLTVTATDGVLADDTGSGLTATVSAAPTHGDLTLRADGGFDYTPNTNYYGTDTFDYVATDSSGQSTGPRTVTISVGLPTAPSAAADSLTATAGDQVTRDATGGLLVNDTGTGITVTGFTQPAHGEVRVDPSGALELHCDAGYAGTDTFSYTITDTWGRTANATVTVTVDAGSATQTQTVPTTGALTVPATEGVLSGLHGHGLRAVLTGQPAHGRVVLGADGSYRYVAEAGYAGEDSFRYEVVDADGHVVLHGNLKLVVRATPAGPATPQPTTTVATGAAGGAFDDATDSPIAPGTPVSSEALASTGVDVVRDAAFGAVLLLAGAALLLVGRRSRRTGRHVRS